MIKQLLLFMVLTLSISTVFAQDKQKIQIDDEGNAIVTPEMEANIRKWQETYENLGSYASFYAKTKDSNGSSKNKAIQISRQKLNDLKFEFFIENKTQVPFDLSFNDGSALIRPELKQNGKIIDYSKDTIKLLQSKDTSPAAYQVKSMAFLPATEKKVPDFAGIGNLQDWYNPLESGFYEITFKFIYDRDDKGELKKLSTQSIFFEILPD